MEVLECTAIVVGYIDYLDHDKIVKLISAEHGLISAMAKGARRAKSRKFTHSLDIGNIVQVQIIPSKSHGSMWKLQQASLKKACHIARRDLHKTALIAYACEIVYSLSAVETPEPKLYGLLETLIQQLNQRKGNEGFGDCYRIAFELKALSFAGLMPTLRRCVACTYPLSTDIKFNVVEGGIFHSNCLPVSSNINKRNITASHSSIFSFENKTNSHSTQQSQKSSSPNTTKRTSTIYNVSEIWRQSALQVLYTPLEESIGATFPNGPKWVFSQMLEFHRQRRLKSKIFLKNIQEPNIRTTDISENPLKLQSHS